MINTILDIIRLLNDGNIVPMQKDEDTKIDLYNEKVQLFMDASGEESKYYYFSELEIDDENQDNLAEIEDVALNNDAYTVIEKPSPSDSYMILFWKVKCIEERMYPDIIKIEENEFFYKKYVFYLSKKNLQGEYRKLGHALKWTWKIIDELCHDDEIQNFYIRLHKFHNWYIIRIGGNGKITFKMEKSMYEISIKFYIYF